MPARSKLPFVAAACEPQNVLSSTPGVESQSMALRRDRIELLHALLVLRGIHPRIEASMPMAFKFLR